jgi:transposase-like protein
VYLYRAIDQYGQVIDVLVSQKRDLAATRRFVTCALEHGSHPTEVSSDRAPAYPRVVDELLPTVMGHEQTSTTFDRYTHPSQDRDQRGRAACGS